MKHGLFKPIFCRMNSQRCHLWSYAKTRKAQTIGPEYVGAYSRMCSCMLSMYSCISFTCLLNSVAGYRRPFFGRLQHLVINENNIRPTLNIRGPHTWVSKSNFNHIHSSMFWGCDIRFFFFINDKIYWHIWHIDDIQVGPNVHTNKHGHKILTPNDWKDKSKNSKETKWTFHHHCANIIWKYYLPGNKFPISVEGTTNTLTDKSAMAKLAMNWLVTVCMVFDLENTYSSAELPITPTMQMNIYEKLEKRKVRK